MSYDVFVQHTQIVVRLFYTSVDINISEENNCVKKTQKLTVKK